MNKENKKLGAGLFNGFQILDDFVFNTSLGENNDIIIGGSRLGVVFTNEQDALTGMVATLDALCYVINISTNNGVIKYNSSSSSVGNRFLTVNGQDLVLPPGYYVLLGCDSLGWHVAPTLKQVPIFTQTADVTVANTTSELTLLGSGIGSLTLPANFFYPGRSIRVKLWGYFTNAGNPTMTMSLKLGSTIIATTGVSTMGPNVSTTLQENEILLTCRSSGATGKIMAQGRCICGTVIMGWVNTAEATIDTTQALTIDVTNTWGTASASNSITITNTIIEQL